MFTWNVLYLCLSLLIISLISICLNDLSTGESGYWSLPLLICGFPSMGYFYNCGCSSILDIDVQNWDIILIDISFDEFEVSIPTFLINVGWMIILLDIRMATTAFFWVCLEELFSSSLLQGNTYFYCWNVFAVCSLVMDPVFTSMM